MEAPEPNFTLGSSHLPVSTLLSYVVLDGSSDLPLAEEGTVDHLVEESSFQLHLYKLKL